MVAPLPLNQSRSGYCPRLPGMWEEGAEQKGPAAPRSVEGSSRIRGEVMDTATCIRGSSQEEMTMLASGSEDTSYLSSVTTCKVHKQHEASGLYLRGGTQLGAQPHAFWNFLGTKTQPYPPEVHM